MTLEHDLNWRLGLGISLSLLLHVLMFMAIAYRPAPDKGPSHYRVRLVDLPPSTRSAPPEVRPLPKQTPPATKPPEAPDKPEPPVKHGPAPEAARPEAPKEQGAPGRVLGPGAIYDTEAIDTAAREPRAREEAESGGVTFSTKDMMYRGYLDMLRQKVESIWRYPPEAASRGLYGDLIIRFVILKDGSLGEVKVLRTSGYGMLDEAAVRALRDGVPYWPLPKGWERDSLPITGRFIYTNFNKSIR